MPGRPEADDVQAARAAAVQPPTEKQLKAALLLVEYEAAGWVVIAFPASIAAGVLDMPANQRTAQELMARVRQLELRAADLGVSLDGEG